MLVIARKQGERLVIGDGIAVQVMAIGANAVRLGVTAPPDISIRRPPILVEPDSSRCGGADYPLWGCRISTHYLVQPRFEKQMRKLLSTASGLNVPWDTLWRVCTDNARDGVQQFWVVDLPQPSRGLGPGELVFQASQIDVEHIPGTAPASVMEAATEARRELPGWRFFYLEPVWKQTHHGRRLLDPDELRQQDQRQQRKYRRRITHWQRFARLLGRDTVRGLRWIKHDPVIVAVPPPANHLDAHRNRTELKLIAHWD